MEHFLEILDRWVNRFNGLFTLVATLLTITGLGIAGIVQNTDASAVEFGFVTLDPQTWESGTKVILYLLLDFSFAFLFGLLGVRFYKTAFVDPVGPSSVTNRIMFFLIYPLSAWQSVVILFWLFPREPFLLGVGTVALSEVNLTGPMIGGLGLHFLTHYFGLLMAPIFVNFVVIVGHIQSHLYIPKDDTKDASGHWLYPRETAQISNFGYWIIWLFIFAILDGFRNFG